MAIAAGKSVNEFMAVKLKNFGDHTPTSFHGVSELSKSSIVNLFSGTLFISCKLSNFCHDVLLNMTKINVKLYHTLLCIIIFKIGNIFNMLIPYPFVYFRYSSTILNVYKSIRKDEK